MAKHIAGHFADRNTGFYLASALAALAIVLVGFNLTYLQPLVSRDYAGPWWGHVHGALALGWVLLAIAQSWLAPRKLAMHRRLGLAALVIIPCWFASTIMIAREAALMALERGDIDGAQNNVLGSITSPLIVLVLVALALHFRRTPQTHKRLIFVASVLMLWPAWARWRHYFAEPDSLFNLFAFGIAMLPIPLSMLRDRLKFGAIHPALLWAGLFVVVEQALEVGLTYSPLWNAVSKMVFDLIT